MEKYKLTKEHIGSYTCFPWARFFRSCAVPIVKFLLHTPIKPNHLTTLCIFLTFIQFGLFASGNPWLILLGAFIMFFDKVLDYADGPLAKCKNMCSLRGQLLDNIHHDLHFNVIFVGLAVGVFVNTGNFLYLICGFIAFVSYKLTRDIFHYRCLLIFRNFKNPEKRIITKDFSKKQMSLILKVKKLIDFPRMHSDILPYYLAPLNLFFNVFPYFIIFYAIYTSSYAILNIYYASTFKEDKR